MRVAIRRTLRVGRRAGAPVEDLGVVPDERHDLTRNDLLKGNVDLINRAGKLLAARPVRQFTATVHDSSATQANLASRDRRDDAAGRLSGRASHSVTLDLKKGGRAAIVVPKKDGPQATLEVRGFDGTPAGRPLSHARGHAGSDREPDHGRPRLRRSCSHHHLACARCATAGAFACARANAIAGPVGGRRRNPAVVAVWKADVEQRLQRQARAS